ncbi:MAG: metalloregulator ArsR/SmtB family transcription factor [Terracidiphilus sp.]
MSSRAQPASLAGIFAALADPTRLRLLNLMAGREVCVCYFIQVLRQSQPKISRHLAYLRRAGVVAVRREGKWMHYRIREPEDAAVKAILSATLSALASSSQMQADRVRFERVCGPRQSLVLPQGAPLPLRLAPLKRPAEEGSGA